MFNDSAAARVKPFRFEEKSTALPALSFPVYTGSGKCVMSLDASGMQGLNNRMQHAYGGLPYSADMYVVGQGSLAKGINRFFWAQYWGEDINTLPFGWFDYSVFIGDKRYDSADIESKGALYSRITDIKRSDVTTEFILDSVLGLSIRAFIPFGTCSPVFAIKVKSREGSSRVTKNEYDVRVEARLNLTVRDGHPLFDKTEFDGTYVRAYKKGYKDYAFRYLVSTSQNAKTQFHGLFAAAALQFTAKNEWSDEQLVMFSLDGENDCSQAGELYDGHIKHWREYFERLAQAETGITEEEFLYNNSLYLFHAGFEPDKSIAIGHPFNFPGCWQASSFWDTTFAMDALCRANDRAACDALLGFYKKALRPSGKPYPWMMIYDGHTFLDAKKDNAPLVIAALAMLAVRHYECFKDGGQLREAVYPIVKRCAEYAADEMFSKGEKGWYVSMPVSNDVVEEQGEEVNQTFTTLWFAVILKKAFEYGLLLGEDNARFKKIADNIYLERDENEYLHCKGYKAGEWKWASWIPFLLYPSEGLPFVDRELILKTAQKYTYTDLYMEKQNSYQPWTECIEAQSLHRLGLTEDSYRLLRAAVGHTFGCGYFSEVGPGGQTGGYPPYISAHSSFTAAYLDQFASVSVWEKKGTLFDMPAAYNRRRVELKNLRCAQNLIVERALYGSGGISAVLSGELEGLELEVFLPPDLVGSDFEVFVNGKRRAFVYNGRRGSVTVAVSGGQRAEIEIV